MRVEIFTVAGSVEVSATGGMTIKNAVDSIGVPHFPFTAPIQIAVRIRFARSEEGTHEIKINAIDSDGNRVGGTTPVNIPTNFGEGSVYSGMGIKTKCETQFEGPGDHSFRLVVDGREQADIMCRVVEAQGI